MIFITEAKYRQLYIQNIYNLKLLMEHWTIQFLDSIDHQISASVLFSLLFTNNLHCKLKNPGEWQNYCEHQDSIHTQHKFLYSRNKQQLEKKRTIKTLPITSGLQYLVKIQ